MEDHLKKQRYHALDTFRGITLIQMVIYHTLFDVWMLSDMDMSWYTGTPGYIWQQFICWSFIFLSGMCRALSKNPLKRGFQVFGCGAVIMLVTAFLPGMEVRFGILTFMGSAMLLVIPFEKLFDKIKPWIGLGISAVLFFLCRNVYDGGLGFEFIKICELPDFLYANFFTTYLGFPYPGFRSQDYFPILPWIFLFLAGYFTWKWIGEKETVKKLLSFNIPVLSLWGRHSLLIYMVHQPVAFGLVWLVYNVIFKIFV